MLAPRFLEVAGIAFFQRIYIPPWHRFRAGKRLFLTPASNCIEPIFCSSADARVPADRLTFAVG